MKITRIRISDFQQFRDFDIDLTTPEGKPLNKVCFIGPNGTGKSTLLNFLAELFKGQIVNCNHPGIWAINFELSNHTSFILFQANKGEERYRKIYQPSIDQEPQWFENLSSLIQKNSVVPSQFSEQYLEHSFFERDAGDFEVAKFLNTQEEIYFKNDGSEFVISAPPEAEHSWGKVNWSQEEVNVESGKKLFDQFPFFQSVSPQHINDFGNLLIYLIRRKEGLRIEFENRPENLKRTKQDLLAEFDAEHPHIFQRLEEIWNPLLEHTNLEFLGAQLPTPNQLSDSIEIKFRVKNSSEEIGPDQLSTGIKNFLFRLGHIASLFFDRAVKQAFLLIDEPETSLFPDFVINLLGAYETAVVDKAGNNNSQMFFATHSPLFAAQFEPQERVIFDWDDNYFVQTRKGVSPVGDDPNDVLSQDFNSRLMGPEGEKNWERYLNLRKKLLRTKEPAQKEKLMEEISKLGNAYNFGASRV